MSFVGDAISGILGGDDAAKASRRASEVTADFQREALDYLKEAEAIPRGFREGALTALGGLYGLEGGEGTQQDLIDRAMESPLYQAIVGTRDAGEEGIARYQAATGGFRSGAMQNALYDYNQRLDERALLESYGQQLQGLSGLAGLPSNVNVIAGQTSDIGRTLGQGITAGAQAEQSAIGQGLGLGTSVLAAKLLSDPRLKTDVEKVGKWKGHNVYRWRWAPEAEKFGLSGVDSGLMADEVEKTNPEAVIYRMGYRMIDYSALEAA